MDDTTPEIEASRRELIGLVAVTPAAVASGSATSPWQADLEKLQRRFDVAPLSLVRTVDGREASAFRYENAHHFFPDARSPLEGPRDILYHAGITAQLALSSHLLDVGFPDAWCARHIGLRVARSLAYANVTGLGHHCPRMHRLARVLTPYWKWNASSRFHRKRNPNDGGFDADEIRSLLAALLKQVRLATGHQPTVEMLQREDGA